MSGSHTYQAGLMPAGLVQLAGRNAELIVRSIWRPPRSPRRPRGTVKRAGAALGRGWSPAAALTAR